MALDLSNENVLSKFDYLAEQGIIHHGPSTAIPLLDENFSFECRICPSWSNKPLTVDGQVPSQEETVKFGPGSDINLSHPDQVIGTINCTHILAFNIYPVFRPQYLLLTSDSYRLQCEPLDIQDFDASWVFLSSERGDGYFMMYNCAEQGGCSRNHKHMQILPKPEFSSPESRLRFFPDVEDHRTTFKVPYVYFLKYFNKKTSMEAMDCFEVYQELLQKCRMTLGIGKSEVCPHNVVLTKDWMVVIPRRTGTYEGIMVNAVGMMGMLIMANEELFAIWKKIGPSKALSEFGVPISGTEQLSVQ